MKNSARKKITQKTQQKSVQKSTESADQPVAKAPRKTSKSAKNSSSQSNRTSSTSSINRASRTSSTSSINRASRTSSTSSINRATRTAGTRAPLVGIIMGSDSDLPIMRESAAALKTLGVSYEMKIVSAHRTPQEMFDYATQARTRGLRVIIAGAGGAAHLPGMVAALTPLPVIGVPVPIGHLQGEDALLSIVQMPRGVPVATVAIGNAFNAGILAAQIIGAGGLHPDLDVLNAIQSYKKDLRDMVLKKNLDAQESSD